METIFIPFNFILEARRAPTVQRFGTNEFANERHHEQCNLTVMQVRAKT
jgi:hypothetical protein